MKIFVWAFSSTLLASGLALAAGSAETKPVPRTAFLGQLPKAMVTEEEKLSFEEVYKTFDKASSDITVNDFEAISTNKFRLTAEGAKQFGQGDENDLVLPSFIKDSEFDSALKLVNVCRTVDMYGYGHGSYAFRYEDSDFVFSGGWIPGSTGSGLSEAMKYMHGKVTPGQGYRIDIPENAAGFYSDFKAPLSVTYRRTPSLLIAAFRNAQEEISGFKVCYSGFQAACQMRAIAKGRYQEPPVTFTNLINYILTGENVNEVKSQILAKAKRDLGCLVDGNDSIDSYVKSECRDGAAACETAKNACAAYVSAKKDMQCGADLSRMNFYAFDKKNNRWLPATSN